MKRFIVGCGLALTILILGLWLSEQTGLFFFPRNRGPVTSFTAVQEKTICLDAGQGLEPFEIRGVDMGVGIPGHFATDYAIDKETYLRWFRQIQDMGANCVRVYTILQDDFYEAVWEYNRDNETPLYFIHGLWVNDYVQYSHRDAYDKDFLGAFLKDSRTLVDIIHGNRTFSLGDDLGSGSYRRDISPWVIGYILGVEWEDTTVAYTDKMLPENNVYRGTYLYTSPDASPFEAMLAQVGDQLIEYETAQYRTQRLLAFTNWPTTDPLQWSKPVEDYFRKFERVDVEHIKTTPQFLSGQFASYHIYPYFPDYLGFLDELNLPTPNKAQFTDENGVFNSYRAYLTMIADYHTMPVVISEFGVPSSRGRAQSDRNTGRAQGGMSEEEQGRALVTCYEDIMAAGCAGSVAFTWQDEWFKRTWNTMAYTDLTKTPYWSDYQTNEQYFGILSFDPGKEESVCYVDGDVSEWAATSPVSEQDGVTLRCKYDEKFFYLYLHKEGYDPAKDVLYVPFDTTTKTGSTAAFGLPRAFRQPADFLLKISGKAHAELLVQERYEALRAIYSHRAYGMDAYLNPPPADTNRFVPINLMLQVPMDTRSELEHTSFELGETFNTGVLTYGNSNPASPSFNSLADYCIRGDDIEVRLPWSLLNFSNPSEMMIHDDYYEHFGIESLSIDQLHVGAAALADSDDPIAMSAVPLKGWGRHPTYHERLKQGYYDLQALWTAD
ncbi:MAG: hypothetical protein RSC08_01645 [Oscillospiraceae bacterium]